MMKKYSLLTIFTLLLNCQSFCQQFGTTTFSQLPQDYQLYPRNTANYGVIPISGKTATLGLTSYSVVVKRNEQVVDFKKASINYNQSIGYFSFVPILIKAEKAEYSMSIYAVKGSDSSLVVSRKNIVAGDVYVITGQSNSTSLFMDPRTNEYCRTFGKITDTYNTSAYNPADTLWTLSNYDKYTYGVGNMGFDFQQQILDKYNIPTCLINGGFHWSSAQHHATRTESNPADLTNGYGRMLYRLQKAGVDKYVKALVYRQGESEAYGEGSGFTKFFDIFYKNLKIDLPSIKQLYAFQIDIIDYASGDVAAKVREEQRKLPNTYNDLQLLASVGTAGFDGLHYSAEGYKQNASELVQLVGRDFYSDTNTDNIDFPNIQRAYFSNTSNTELTLVFQKSQQVVWPSAVKGLSPFDIFYFDGKSGNVIDGKVSDNNVILKLKAAPQSNIISYLPSLVESSSAIFPYSGPYIQNKRGLRAFSFFEYPIESKAVALTTPIISFQQESETSAILTWNAIAKADTYLIELINTQTGKSVFYQQTSQTAVTIKQLEPLVNYSFSVKAVNGIDESVKASVTVILKPSLVIANFKGQATYYNTIALDWSVTPYATNYVLERKTGTDGTYQVIANLGVDNKVFTDTKLSAGITYFYRIKATVNELTSSYQEISVTTPSLLSSPEIASQLLSNKALKLVWKAVLGATSYTLERKVASGTYLSLGTLGVSTQEYVDSNLIPSQQYSYRIKAYSSLSESLYSEVTTTLPAVLETPVLAGNITYNNALTLSWKAVPNASYFQVERKIEGGSYVKIANVNSPTLSYADTNLIPNTSYVYRIKAYSSNSESVYSELTLKLPALLTTPSLVATAIDYQGVQLSWTAVKDAISYVLERGISSSNEVSYSKIATVESSVLSFSDVALKDNTSYAYRLTAYGNKTNSPASVSIAKTPIILAVETEPSTIAINAYPNPAQTTLFLAFNEVENTDVTLLNFLGKAVLTASFKATDMIQLDVADLVAGLYFVQVKRANKVVVIKVVIN